MTGQSSARNAELFAAIDAHGGDLARWPDRQLANRVREAALAHRALRAYLDGASHLDQAMRAARDGLDRDIAAGGAADRIARAVRARRAAKRRLRWMAAAAAIIVAAGIGGLVDSGIVAASTQQNVEVVVLDPLVFGPLDSGTE
jgi:hypothetical protein